jgi:hypothetical protein
MPIHENLRVIADMAKHDPLVILGFCLLGASGILYARMLVKMSRAGLRVVYWRFDGKYRLPSEYLKARRDHGWSPWPAYLIWPCVALGIAALVGGLFLLPD